MRSIGKVNIKKLKTIVTEVMQEVDGLKNNLYNTMSMAEIKKEIENRIPDKWHYIWESATAEIERLTQDFIMEYNRR